jgi:amidohydrolase
VTTNIGGHGVVGILRNGPGKTILIRAELDALPILEQSDVPYKSTKRMVDRYGNERPVMHACGHDMKTAELLGASALLKAAKEYWSGRFITLFQPDEEETGGAQAMVNDGLYDKIPVPNVILAQYLVPLMGGQAAVKSGPALVAADAVNVRVTGGPCEGSANPQWCVDPIPLAMGIVTQLQNHVRRHIGSEEEASIACWGFHAGDPGNNYVAYADFLLDVKTVDSVARKRVLELIDEKIRADCEAAHTLKEPSITSSVRAPLTNNNDETTTQVRAAFDTYFGSRSVSMKLTRACEDFSILAAPHDVPYTYWNFGGSKEAKGEIPSNHSPLYAPLIEPTLEMGTDAMALAVLSFVAKSVEG